MLLPLQCPQCLAHCLAERKHLVSVSDSNGFPTSVYKGPLEFWD